MATTSGTATSAENLWGILLNFVTANGWTILDQGTSTTATEELKGVQLSGADLSGTGNIYVHLLYRAQLTQDIYGIEIEGSAGYLPGTDVLQFGQNPQNSYRDVGTTTSVIIHVPLHRNPIDYWITASPRRFMGAFHHNDRWGALYCGFVLPYGMPSQWPYPLWVAGNNITTNDYKVITNGCPWGASNVISGMIYAPGGRWLSTPIAGSPGGGHGYSVLIWPYQLDPAKTRIPGCFPLKDKNGVEMYSLYNQIFYCPYTASYGTYGEVDGMNFVSSWGASGGDILTFNSQEWLLIQREMSTANQTSVAMLLE